MIVGIMALGLLCVSHTIPFQLPYLQVHSAAAAAGRHKSNNVEKKDKSWRTTRL